ncbi:MAG: winged helix-turn-helix domain-containing protein [Candidatus Promineifilaceae bacterium]
MKNRESSDFFIHHSPFIIHHYFMGVDNPFYHRGAIRQVDSFFGRKQQLDEMLGLLRNRQSISVVGPRRIGKSSLLLHLTRPQVRESFGLAPPDALFVLLDCQEFGGSPPEEIYEALLYGLHDSAENGGLELKTDRSRGGTYRNLDRALNQATRAGASVVVLLDEFELLAANPQLTPYFFARLRGLTTKYGLAFVTASQRPLYAITADEAVLSSPFFNIFVQIQLGLLRETEAYGLLAHRLEGSSVQFSADTCEYLVNLVGAHPFFLHIAGYHTFQAICNDHPQEKSATRAEIADAIAVESDSHLNYLWSNLLLDEQYALATLEGAIDIMRMLEQQCFALRDGDVYTYPGSLLCTFVRRQSVSGLIQADPFLIDQLRHHMKANGELIPLTNSQFALMSRLGKQYGQVVQGSDLEIAVWGEILVDDPDRLKTLIKRLRRAIGRYGDWIVSERGIGYALRKPH